ncbi:3914_t:CDS:2 [Racocetra fulgida]|uniref:3914_t:CDS:1 n=1 Tax=Racocetra fulgida TaxID=60492 RepID=A0A9N8VNT5_9GLOM|nr:3914_t:CDS:2 [Racocetra fulgida]
MHFGATTTQRVEGAHSAMKHAIKTSGNLTKAFNSLDRWLRLHHEENSLQYENESISIDPLLAQEDKDRLEPLLGKVSQFALNKIKNELLSTTAYKACFFSDEQQKTALLNKLDDILAVPEVKLSDIKVPEKIVGKGRPSGTKRLPTALEHQSSKILLNYRIPANDIDQIYNPLNDGNCGFCALAFAIRGNEENWDLIKLAMNNQLSKRMEVYKDWLGYNTDSLKWILEFRASPCQPSQWFVSPDCAQLAASTFAVPIAIFDEKNEQSMLFFPLETPPVHRKTSIILHFINGNHIVYVGMKSYAKINWPAVNVQHIPLCRKYGIEDHWSKLFA